MSDHLETPENDPELKKKAGEIDSVSFLEQSGFGPSVDVSEQVWWFLQKLTFCPMNESKLRSVSSSFRPSVCAG